MLRTQELVIESWISRSAGFEHLQRWKDDIVHKEQTRSNFDHVWGRSEMQGEETPRLNDSASSLHTCEISGPSRAQRKEEQCERVISLFC